jgi:hypothetical protein
MIKAVCINDKHKPIEIPIDYWIKQGEPYHIIAIYKMVQPGAVMGVLLKEINLDENCTPFECFRIGRFGFTKEDLPTLIAMIEACEGLQDFDPMKLIEEEIGELLET